MVLSDHLTDLDDMVIATDRRSSPDELALANAQVNLGFEWEDAASLIDCLYSDDHPSIESINGWIDALTSLRDSLAGQVV